MEKSPYEGRHLVGLIITLLGSVTFTCCICAEFKRAKERDMKLDGNLCYLPRTPAFELGITAVLCLSIAQIVGTTASRNLLRSSKRMAVEGCRWMSTVPFILLAFSWVTFGLVVILLGTASSMNKGQIYGKGWLDGECYVVKNGIYVSAAFLNLVVILSTLTILFPWKRAVPSTQPNELTKQNSSKKVKSAGA